MDRHLLLTSMFSFDLGRCIEPIRIFSRFFERVVATGEVWLLLFDEYCLLDTLVASTDVAILLNCDGFFWLNSPAVCPMSTLPTAICSFWINLLLFWMNWSKVTRCLVLKFKVTLPSGLPAFLDWMTGFA